MSIGGSLPIESRQTIEHAAIDVTGTGDQILLEADATRALKIFYLELYSSAPNLVFEIKSGASTMLTKRPLSVVATTPTPYVPEGHFVTAPAEALVIDIPGILNVNVFGHVVFERV